jgi:segregation and condensation protein A
MYRVQLQNFEGPLDLLLFFIRRDELDIYDIPIAYITKQFLDYIQFLDELDLGVASEFIYMASSLMSIKAKMMLPRIDSEDSEFDENDPRYDLVQSLLEYKRYKEVGSELQEMDAIARQSFRRNNFDLDLVEEAVDQEPLRDVTLFDLIAAYRLILNRVKREEIVHKVSLVKANIVEQSRFIIQKLRNSGRLSFWELCSDIKDKMVLIVTFLAILEMVKDQELVLLVNQESTEFSIELPSAQEVLKSQQKL